MSQNYNKNHEKPNQNANYNFLFLLPLENQMVTTDKYKFLLVQKRRKRSVFGLFS